MKIVPIFGASPEGLYAVQLLGEERDEFRLLFASWDDPLFLEEFFTANQADLMRPFYNHMSVEEAMVITRQEARNFARELRSRVLSPSDGKTLQMLFKPLDNRSYQESLYEKSKAYGPGHKSWLRVYAIRISATCFVVTGGAIKLTLGMEADHLKEQLTRLEQVKMFLKARDIQFDEDVYELTQEEDES